MKTPHENDSRGTENNPALKSFIDAQRALIESIRKEPAEVRRAASAWVRGWIGWPLDETRSAVSKSAAFQQWKDHYDGLMEDVTIMPGRHAKAALQHMRLCWVCIDLHFKGELLRRSREPRRERRVKELARMLSEFLE